MPSVTFNRRQLMIELSTSEPILKKEAIAVARKTIFDPAVKQMMEDFNEHPVTEEIRAGVDSPNISGTLEADFHEDDDRSSVANLTSFIGFDKAQGDPTAPIAAILTPNNQGTGPLLEYQGMDKGTLSFRFKVYAPSTDALYGEKTDLPWAPGVSWAQRIEVGLAGIGQFLNEKGKAGSRSGGGIQIENTLRGGRFGPVSYLSGILRDFLARVSGRR